MASVSEHSPHPISFCGTQGTDEGSNRQNHGGPAATSRITGTHVVSYRPSLPFTHAQPVLPEGVALAPWGPEFPFPRTQNC